MGRGHARSGLEPRPTGDGREDAGPRRGDVDVGAEVGVAGEPIVGAAAAAARRRAATRLAVEVGEGRDGDDLGVGGRHDPGRVDGAVAGRDDHGDTGVDGVADRLVVGVGVARPVRTTPTKTHVDDIDGAGVGDYPVEPADDRGLAPAPGVVEYLDGPQPGARRHADDPGAVVQRADGAGDVRAVAVAVAVAATVGAILTTGHVEVRVRGDPGVEHGHVRVDRPPGAVNGGGRVLVGVHPVDSAWEGLGEGRDRQVLGDDEDVRIARQSLHRGRRHVAGEPTEHVPIDVLRVDAGLACLRFRIGVPLEHDDDVSGRGLRGDRGPIAVDRRPSRPARSDHDKGEDDGPGQQPESSPQRAQRPP